MSWKIRELTTLSSGITVEELASEFRVPEWLARVLHQRMKGWADPSLEAVRKFLEPNLKQLPDPYSLPDMDRATERLAEAITEKQKIVIYGDYDVDGTVGSALLRRFFRSLGIEATVYQPDRQLEGYGINGDAVKKLASEGAQLMIAVDCGITSVKEVELANELGLDVIICDHHEPKETLPPAYAVLDHKRSDNNGPIRSLSGAGVAFYLALATRSLLREIGHFESEGIPEPDLRNLFDLVALAIVADLVPLVDENRILLKYGLDKIHRNPTVGIREMLNVAGVDNTEVSGYHLGFILGPRINASGRLGSANTALELLSTDDSAYARSLAEQLESVNRERMEIQASIAKEALEQADSLIKENGEDLAALVLISESWHEGVIGIVASKVMERFHRPVAVVTLATHNGLGKGSVRGLSGLDMTMALDGASEFLVGFGGHKAAAGFSVKKENFANFRESFVAAVRAQALKLSSGTSAVLVREVWADAFVEDDRYITKESVAFLEKLAPFGMGNPEPVLMLSGWKITGAKTLKERHLKISFASKNNTVVEGFWANGVEKFSADMDKSADWELACLPQINTFRSLNKLEFKIKELKRS